jgi:hypothetical protein
MTVAISMTKDVPFRQDVLAVSGHGPLMTLPNGRLQMLCADVNRVMARLVPSLLRLISPMETPVAVSQTENVPVTPGALAATGLGPL